MKTRTSLGWRTIVLLASAAAGVSAGSQDMTDVATYGQVAAARRRADQMDPMKRMTPSSGENPVANRPKDILAESDILCFQGMATLVPKRAIMRIPKNQAGRIGIQPGARMVSWNEFLAANRGWITTVDVSWKQAAGDLDMSEDTRKVMSRSGNLVVATYKGGPISVLPLKQLQTASIEKP